MSDRIAGELSECGFVCDVRAVRFAAAAGKSRPRPDRLSDQKRSTTDPDATLQSRPGKATALAYKVHLGVDESHGVITAVSATSAGADDTSQIPALLDQHQKLLGPPKTVVADSTYGSQEALGYLQERRIETVIPVRTGGNRHGKFDKSLFMYDSKSDTFSCPAGRCLKRQRVNKKQHKIIYACEPAACLSCPLRFECVSSEMSPRQIVRFDTPYVDRAMASCRSSRGRHLLCRRQTVIEGRFAAAKTRHALSRARWRGVLNLTIQALLTATVLNVKKLLQRTKAKTPAVGNTASATASRFRETLFCNAMAAKFAGVAGKTGKANRLRKLLFFNWTPAQFLALYRQMKEFFYHLIDFYQWPLPPLPTN